MDAHDRIYVVDGADTLHALERKPYDSEDLLQTLLERYPDLLAGEQMDAAEPRRWALVSREVGVPGEEGGADRWSLDHLFLDQDGVPTLVEVKRSTDTRIRREVVGQMLDYAANAVVYWPVERIVAAFEEASGAEGSDAAERVAALTGEPDAETAWDPFWQRVKTNLQAGRVRLVFVADVVPPELRRIVEFLNGQMDPAEVVAVEVRHYVGGALRTLVPRLVGQTAQAEQRKTGARREKRQWDESSFLASLEVSRGRDERLVGEALIGWAREMGLREWWGTGAHSGSFIPIYDHGDRAYYTFNAWCPAGTIEIPFQNMRGVFGTEEKKGELLRRLDSIPGLTLSHHNLNGRPSLTFAELLDPERRRRFLDVFEWLIREVESDAPRPSPA